jgi:beta-lactamase class D
LSKLRILGILVILLLFQSRSPADTVFSFINFKKFFVGLTGAFVLQDVQKDLTVRNDEAEAAKRFSPCSTFDILLALSGLQSGILKDQHTTLSLRGTESSGSASARQETLESALQASGATFFDELARRIGPQKLEEFVRKTSYGNAKVQQTGAEFWRDGPLLISADEQVKFLTRLYRDQLPFDATATEIVKNLIVKSGKGGKIFSGRSGDCNSENVHVAWFVGHLKTTKGEYVFATILEGGSDLIGQKAEAITRSILQEMKLL